MASTRAQRVGEAIHKEVSAMLIKGLKDPRIGFVTITAVQVNSDLSLAKIYFTVMGEEKARIDTAAGLKSAVPFLRREVGKLLRLRHAPELVFHYDDSIEYAHRMEALIRQAQTGQGDDRDDS